MGFFSGIWVALVTPFRDGEIDFAGLRTLARHLAGAGVDGLVVCGSTGEAAALDDAEQLAVLDAVIDAVPNCPIVMGLAGNNLGKVLASLQQFQARPIAGVLVPPPCYIRPSQAGLLEYFHAVARASAVPVILYNIPYRTGINLELETIRALAQHERIVAIKDCGGDPAMTMNLIADRSLDVLAGEDQQIFSTLCLGGAGAITAAAHVRPDLFVRLARCIAEERLSEARQLCHRLLPMIQVLFEEPNPAGPKAAMAYLGLIRNELRAPMQTASTALNERIICEIMRLETCAPIKA